MTMKNGKVQLLLVAAIIILLPGCSTMQRARPQPTVAPTNISNSTPIPSTATPPPEPTSTPAPPTASATQPPTATPLPTTPTLSPVPAVERIRFAPGATQGTVEGSIPADGAQVFVMGVAAGQFIEMNAAVGTIGQGLRFSIVGADAVVVKPLGEATFALSSPAPRTTMLSWCRTWVPWTIG